MEDPRTAPSLSPAEAEESFATGRDARSAVPGPDGEPGYPAHPEFSQGSPTRSGRTGAAGEGPAQGLVAGGASETQLKLPLPTDGCCEGVDVPGLGMVHAHDCRNERPVLRASRTYQAVTTVDEERGQRCTVAPQRWTVAPADAAELAGLGGPFGQLLFAARDLAESRIIDAAGGVLQVGFCLECGGSISAAGSRHLQGCRTVRVLELVARICAASPTSKPDLKAQLRASIDLVDRQNGGAR